MIGGLQRAVRRYLLDEHAAEARSRALGILRARWVLRGCECGERVSAQCAVRVVTQGRIRIGAHTQFLYGLIPQELVAGPGAELVIGEGTLFNYGASIRAARSVRLGKRCMIASFTSIRDESGGRVAPVVLGDDVWVTHGAMVEPGVTIGDGCVISAGSVVVSDVPAGMIAIGNPATYKPLSARGAAAFGWERRGDGSGAGTAGSGNGGA